MEKIIVEFDITSSTDEDRINEVLSEIVDNPKYFFITCRWVFKDDGGI